MDRHESKPSRELVDEAKASESAEPLARSADDPKMNAYLREQLLGEDDPMNDYMSKKQLKIKMKTEFVYPTYKGQHPPNRYGIAPGYRWDGVNRSSGFEAKFALQTNKRVAEKTEAYRSIAEIAE